MHAKQSPKTLELSMASVMVEIASAVVAHSPIRTLLLVQQGLTQDFPETAN